MRKAGILIIVCGLSVRVLSSLCLGNLAEERTGPSGSGGNRVLSLDGEADYMRVADSQSLHSFSDAITIEVWLKASSFYAEDRYINSIIRKNIEQGIENFFLRFRNDAGKPIVEMSIGYDIETLHAPCEFTVGTWYHLAGTFDGSTMTVLADGVIIESNKVSGPLYIDESDLFIGKGDPEFSFGEYFHGSLDEIRIWNIARSPEEIQAAMSTPLSGKEEGLVAYWNFDDGTAKDLSGHGSDGVLNGDAQIVESPLPTSLAPQEKKPNKLVAWWKLDEADGNDVADSSGNGQVGRLVGNPQWQPAGGKIGGALEFDGDGDYVEVGNESVFDITGAITVAAWIKVNSFDKRWQAIVTKGDTAWRIQRTDEENTIAFKCTGIASIRTRHGVEGNKNVNDGNWHHIVGIYDGSTVSLYIDGILDDSGEASGSIQTNDSPVFIGANSEVSDREWNGLIDEVCVIAGAIDAKGVQALYSGEDPMMVAQTAVITLPTQAAVAEPQSRPRPATDAGARGDIEGDWQIVSDEVSQKAIIEIQRESDGTLAAAIVAEGADQASGIMPLDEVTFENGKLRFEMKSNQGVFEGTMKEDGLTIEGQFQRQGQMVALVLKRVDAAPSEAVPASQEQLQGRDKLVAWWKFDNNTDDSAGDNHGTAQGNPVYAVGKFGQAISFDGDDYVDCGKPSLLDFGVGNWTVSAWIKTTQSGTDDENEPNRGTVFANGGDEAGGIRYTLAVNEGQSGMITLTTDDDLSKVQAISTTAVNDGAWHHVVGIRNEGTLGVYVDGVLERTEILPTGYSLSGVSQQKAYVGVIADNRDGSLFKYFVGLIDELCIFACALDADSVSALYSGQDPMTVAKEAATTAPAQSSDEQLEYPISGTSNVATVLILVLGLAGLIGAIVLFLVKSSIRT